TGDHDFTQQLRKGTFHGTLEGKLQAVGTETHDNSSAGLVELELPEVLGVNGGGESCSHGAGQVFAVHLLSVARPALASQAGQLIGMRGRLHKPAVVFRNLDEGLL